MPDPKGYYSAGDYWGMIDGEYMRFESHKAYLDYFYDYYAERRDEDG